MVKVKLQVERILTIIVIIVVSISPTCPVIKIPERIYNMLVLKKGLYPLPYVRKMVCDWT